MLKMNAWLHRVAVVAAVVMLLIQVHAVLAQDVPPAKAPTPAEAGEVNAPPGLPEAAGAADRQARVQAMRERWRDLAAETPARGSGIQMIVQGDYVYVLFGTVLCQLSAQTLELKAKVDLRELVLGDRAARREQRGARPARAGRAEAPAAQPAAPAQP